MRAIVFDVDGVLKSVDSEEEVLKRAFAKHGIEFKLKQQEIKALQSLETLIRTRFLVRAYLREGENLRRLLDLSYNEALEESKRILEVPEDELARKIYEATEEFRKDPEILKLTRPIPENRKEFLKKLKRDFSLAILTNNWRDTLEKLIPEDELELFDVIITSSDVSKPKPDPEGMFKIIEKLGLDSKDILYVGDSISDYRVAQKAGTMFVGVLTGAFHPRWAKELKITTIPDVSYLLI